MAGPSRGGAARLQQNQPTTLVGFGRQQGQQRGAGSGGTGGPRPRPGESRRACCMMGLLLLLSKPLSSESLSLTGGNGSWGQNAQRCVFCSRAGKGSGGAEEGLAASLQVIAEFPQVRPLKRSWEGLGPAPVPQLTCWCYLFLKSWPGLGCPADTAVPIAPAVLGSASFTLQVLRHNPCL